MNGLALTALILSGSCAVIETGMGSAIRQHAKAPFEPWLGTVAPPGLGDPGHRKGAKLHLLRIRNETLTSGVTVVSVPGSFKVADRERFSFTVTAKNTSHRPVPIDNGWLRIRIEGNGHGWMLEYDGPYLGSPTLLRPGKIVKHNITGYIERSDVILHVVFADHWNKERRREVREEHDRNRRRH